MRNVSVNLTPDNQIEVRVGSESRAGESYYLGLQPGSDNHEFRPVDGTIQLVGEWIRLLTILNDGEQLFLPFDFADEYTRWLTVHRDGCDVTVVFGWADVEGWSIFPQDLSQYAHGLPNFMPDEPLHTQTFYLPQVLSNLRQSLAILRTQERHSETLRHQDEQFPA